jgi:hypothetical protein
MKRIKGKKSGLGTSGGQAETQRRQRFSGNGGSTIGHLWRFPITIHIPVATQMMQEALAQRSLPIVARPFLAFSAKVALREQSTARERQYVDIIVSFLRHYPFPI